MLFRISQTDGRPVFQPYPKRTASELGLFEKDLENWIARHPELLFGAERVLVIGQSISGQSMADILALDGDGRLVVVEMKRDWSDRSTVGQLLEYSARLSEMSFDQFEGIARSYWGEPEASLLDKFVEFFDDQPERETLGNKQRLVIIAPDTDEELHRIVRWLKRNGALVDFVPFTLYAEAKGSDVFVDIEHIARPPAIAATSFPGGDWFFNTNETNSPGAYRKMFDQGVIAIYGYETGPDNLTGGSKGQRVFAYVNRRGIMAVGRIVDGSVFPSTTVFDEDREFHVRVDWDIIVAEEMAVTPRQVQEAFGYGLPVRSVFCGISRHDAANWIAQELKRRQTTKPTPSAQSAELSQLS